MFVSLLEETKHVRVPIITVYSFARENLASGATTVPPVRRDYSEYNFLLSFLPVNRSVNASNSQPLWPT